MDLGEVLKTYLGGDQSGQLVIKFVGESHLCKISIVNGEAVYLTLGNMGPDDTLDAIVGKTAEWNNFINGMPARKQLDQPLNELLINIAGATPPASGQDPVAVAVTSAAPAASDLGYSEDIAPDRVSAIVDNFINLVGPLGTILAEKVSSNLSYTNGSAMNAATYNRFVAALAAEVPEGDRQTFIDTASK